MDSIQTLAEYFSKFPGIGPRQAKRFVYFLLREDHGFTGKLADAIRELRNIVTQCTLCFRFFEKNSTSADFYDTHLCDICRDPGRDVSMLLVVEKDADFENIRKSGNYQGLFFLLGGSLPILEKNPSQKVRARELFDRVQNAAKNTEKTGELKEVILAMNATPEGENTTLYILKILEPLVQKYNFKLSTLGRGLSTGTELEYSDVETFKSALESRK